MSIKFFTVILLFMNLFLSCSSLNSPSSTKKDFVYNGKAKSYIDGKASGLKKIGGIEIEAIFDNYNEDTGVMTFRVQLMNATTEAQLFEIKDYALHFFKEKKMKALLKLSVLNPIVKNSEFDLEIKKIEDERNSALNNLSGLVDVFTKDTSDKQKREADRKAEEEKYDEKIKTIMNEKEQFSKQALMPIRLREKETAKGLIYFHGATKEIVKETNYLTLDFGKDQNSNKKILLKFKSNQI